MSALIITPASSSFFWTNDFKKSILLSGLFAVISSIAGVFISYLSPSMPTGPWIIVALSAIALFSAFFSGKGIFTKKIKARKNNRKMISDNILKALYRIGESTKTMSKSRTTQEILNFREVQPKELTTGLNVLKNKGLVVRAGELWTLTEQGIKEAKRIIRIHRLWELYMEKFMLIQTDHVHESAESIEHIMTPALEKELLKYLGNPTTDPHQQNIPYED